LPSCAALVLSTPTTTPGAKTASDEEVPKAETAAPTAAKASGTLTAVSPSSVTLSVDPSFGDLPSTLVATAAKPIDVVPGTKVVFLLDRDETTGTFRLDGLAPIKDVATSGADKPDASTEPPAPAGTKGYGKLIAAPAADSVTVTVAEGDHRGETLALGRSASTRFMVGETDCDPADLPAGTGVLFVASATGAGYTADLVIAD
jgi:hypothetical protein